jgi:hypothetical protein
MKQNKPSKYEQDSWSTTTSLIIIAIVVTLIIFADNF